MSVEDVRTLRVRFESARAALGWSLEHTGERMSVTRKAVETWLYDTRRDMPLMPVLLIEAWARIAQLIAEKQTPVRNDDDRLIALIASRATRRQIAASMKVSTPILEAMADRLGVELPARYCGPGHGFRAAKQ